jgi:transposase
LEVGVGLGVNVAVDGVEDAEDGPLRVHVRKLGWPPRCDQCSDATAPKDRTRVELVDLAAFGRPTRLVWSKQRRSCRNPQCEAGSFTEQDAELASPRCRLTTRAGKWATAQVGRFGRPVSDIAAELGCSWHTVNDAVIAWGEALLEADVDRVGDTRIVGLDETLAVRQGVFRHRVWATTIADVEQGQLIDMIEGRDATAVCGWFADQDPEWTKAIAAVTLDMSATYLLVANTVLPGAKQIVDRFHLIKWANQGVDECRRRIQNQTLGRRGRKHDPLYRARRRLTIGAERLRPDQTERVETLLATGDPTGALRQIWLAKEQLRAVFDRADRGAAAADLLLLAQAWMAAPRQPELRKLGRTVWRWRTQILNWFWWHQTSNGPTEAINNLIKRVKRAAFGFRRFDHYRIRALLYAGQPNWDLLPTLTISR